MQLFSFCSHGALLGDSNTAAPFFRSRLYPAGSHRGIISHAEGLGLARLGHMFPYQNSICITVLSPQ